MRQSVSKCCSWHSLHSPRAAKTKAVHEPFVAATPATYRDISRHVAALSEFGLRFLNGRRRSVNRKVQGSSPWPGANFEYKTGLSGQRELHTLLMSDRSGRIDTGLDTEVPCLVHEWC